MELITSNKRAEIAFSGTSMTLQDAASITTTDVRFPSSPQIAAEKLCGWSVVIDVFHGVNHAVSNAVRDFVTEVGPALHQVYSVATENPEMGMDHVSRVLFEAQQDYFSYAQALANGGAPRVPDFSRIRDQVRTFRAGALAPLPHPWYTHIKKADTPQKTATPSARDQAGAGPRVNSNADSRLMTRFRDSGFPSIGKMLEGHEVTIPKHAGKDVCLAWALKGQCSSGCKRQESHKSYPRSVVAKIHELMDTCGVANSQP